MARGGQAVVLVAALSGVGASGACGGVSSESCVVGSEACACRSDGTCESGLRCYSNVCVRPSDDNTGGSAGNGPSGASGGRSARVCVADSIQTCVADDGCTGTQRCLADGSGFGDCVCTGTNAGGTGGTGGGASLGGAVGLGGGTGGYTGGANTLLPSDGFIQGGGPDGRIWGAWYTFGGQDSVFTPPEGEWVSAVNGQICFSGTVAQVIGGEYAVYYGAVIGFDLCGMPGDMSTCDQWMPPEFCSWAPESKHTVTECGIALNTISFDIVGTLPSSELRVVFKEQNRDENTYLLVGGQGAFSGAVAEAAVAYDAAAPPINPSVVEAIHFQVASMETGPVDFDFCIRNLQIY